MNDACKAETPFAKRAIDRSVEIEAGIKSMLDGLERLQDSILGSTPRDSSVKESEEVRSSGFIRNLETSHSRAFGLLTKTEEIIHKLNNQFEMG